MDILNVSRSRLTRDLLGFFFANAGKSFYLRELERTLGHSVGNIRRLLVKLEKAGLFEVEYKANLAFYRLNKSFPLYDELKSIVTKTIGLTGLFKETLSPIKGIRNAFIYGSYAKGSENEHSDIDLCIVGNSDMPALLNAIIALEGRIKREINYTVYSEKEFEEKRNEKGGFLNLVLEGKIIPILGDLNAAKADGEIVEGEKVKKTGSGVHSSRKAARKGC